VKDVDLYLVQIVGISLIATILICLLDGEFNVRFFANAQPVRQEYVEMVAGNAVYTIWRK
jgi:hypothetical protein